MKILLIIGLFLNLTGTIMLAANAFRKKKQVIQTNISSVTVVQSKHKANSLEKTLENASEDDPRTKQAISDLVLARTGLIALGLGFIVQLIATLFSRSEY